MGYYSDLDIAIQEKIREYEAENGIYDYYGFKDGEIYGISEEELIKELEEADERIKNGEEECYTIDEVDELLSSKVTKSLDLKVDEMLRKNKQV